MADFLKDAKQKLDQINKEISMLKQQLKSMTPLPFCYGVSHSQYPTLTIFPHPNAYKNPHLNSVQERDKVRERIHELESQRHQLKKMIIDEQSKIEMRLKELQNEIASFKKEWADLTFPKVVDTFKLMNCEASSQPLFFTKEVIDERERIRKEIETKKLEYRQLKN